MLDDVVTVSDFEALADASYLPVKVRDFINGGETLGPGAFVTHPRAVVHGPRESRTGCSILTLQTAYVDTANPDFHIVD